ncbi:MAG TPA: hypothetical protein DCR14_11305 [Acidimicrobiaceae bacterium]|nr:hypothetical protein [Acidimicrobiaceae bacterium]
MYDLYDYQAASDEWQAASDQVWALQVPLQEVVDAAWAASDYETMHEAYQAMYAAEHLGNEMYDYSWDVYNGPVNAEGYTMYDASVGYTSTDTSFIEPASSAGSCSMISDYNAESSL